MLLIIEDNISLLRLYGRILEHHGYKVVSVSSLLEAYQWLDTHRFRVVLVDIQIEQDTTISLLEEYRNTFQQHNTHVIGMSGDEKYREILNQLGYLFFLVKPIDKTTLLDTVAQLL